MNTFNKYSSKSLWLTVIMLGSLAAGCSNNNNDNDSPAPAPEPAPAPAATKLIVSSTNAPDEATNIAVNQKIVVIFNREMNRTSIDNTSFTVVGANEPALDGTVSLDAKSKTVTFLPNSKFTANTLYTATITTAAKSATGATLASNYVWTFTSGALDSEDVTPPNAVSFSPAETEANVFLNQNITVKFDEALDHNTTDATSFKLTADFGSGPEEIAGAVSYNNKTASFNPTDYLVANTDYTATLTTAITDLVFPANALAANIVWSFTTGALVATGPPAIDLGSAANFAIMTGTGITSADGSSVIAGNIGASGITGAAITVACTELTNEVYTDDANYPGTGCTAVDKTAADLALKDVLTAYTNASDPVTPAGVGPYLELGAGTVTTQTLIPGVYTWAGNVTITGEITLDGSATDVWVFQIDGTLDSNQPIILAGGALAKNVFWRVAETVSLNTGAQFKGTVLAKANVDMIDGATITGRLLAQTAVNLGSTTAVTQPAP